MNRTIATIIIFSFIGIAVFGFLGIEFMNNHHMGCIASTSQAGMCPESGSPMDFVNFHLNALKNFSVAVLSSLSILAALLVSVLLIVFAEQRRGALASEVTVPHPLRSVFLDFHPPLCAQLTHWLSLHENSPAAV